MSDAERFKDINQQCEHVAELIRHAQNISDPVLSEHLYREARNRTQAISGAIRQLQAAMTAARGAINRAA